MKKIILILFAILSIKGSSQQTDSLQKQIHLLLDSLSAAKQDSAKIPVYKGLYQTYDRLGKAYFTLYSDSASSCLDSTFTLYDRYVEEIKEKAKQDLATKDTKEESPGKNSFNFRLYTDFVGFKGDQPNGLAQTELSFQWKLNPKRYRMLLIAAHPQPNKSELRYNLCQMKKDRNKLQGREKAKKKDELRKAKTDFNSHVPRRLGFFENLVFPIIELSKIKDSLRYKELDYDTTSHTKHIHTLDLIKHSNFNVSGKLNVLSYHSVKNNIYAYFDVFGTFYSTGIYDKDTLLDSKDQKHNINSVGWGSSVKIVFAPEKSNFYLEASYQNYGLKLLNPDIIQRKTTLYYPEYNPKNNVLNNSNTLDAVSAYVASVRYSSKMNKENKNKDGIYLRIAFFNHMSGTPSQAHNPFAVDYKNNFLQVQLGVSKSIEDLVKFIKP